MLPDLSVNTPIRIYALTYKMYALGVWIKIYIKSP